MARSGTASLRKDRGYRRELQITHNLVERLVKVLFPDADEAQGKNLPADGLLSAGFSR